MKRIIYKEDAFGEKKYVLIEEYKGCGIYQHKTPTGYLVHQDWLISFGDDKAIICQSYNNMCKEELLDAIDEYAEFGKFGFMTIKKGNNYIIHNSGKVEI